MLHRSWRWFTLTATALALLTGAVYLTGALSERAGIEKTREAGAHRLDLYAAGLDAELRKYDHLPALAHLNPDVIALLHQPLDMALRDRVNRYLRNVSEATNSNVLYILDDKGITLASSNWSEEASFVGQDFSFRPYFQNARKDGHGRFYGIGATSKTAGYYYSYGIFDKGKALGVAVLKVSLGAIETSWQQSGETILVVDANGVIFLSSIPAWKYKTTGALSEQVVARMRATRQYESVTTAPMLIGNMVDVAGDAQLLSLGNPANLDDGAAGRTREYLAQRRGLASSDWQLMLLSDLAPVRSANRQAAFATVFVFAFLLLLFHFIVQRRRAIAQSLAAKEALQRAHDELEQKVESRTADLSASNDKLRKEISERERAEQVLREAQDDLVQAEKMAVLGQMSAGVTHELNQPLAALRTLADNTQALLERGQISNARSNLSRIAQIVDRMSKITGQLKSFARKASTRLTPVSVQRALTNSLLLIEQRLQHGEIVLEQEIPDDEIMVSGDASRLEQVLVNLLCNACDAMAACPVRRLHISVRRLGSRVRIAVLDSGSGITQEVLPRLFEPFFTTKEAGAGLGLGLAISAGIIRDFGGTLRVTDGHEGGTEFVIELQNASEEIFRG